MLIPRLGIAKKSHLPAFKILDFSFGPISIVRVLWSTRKLSLKDLGQEAMVKTQRSRLRLTRAKAALMMSEWSLWNRFYIPRAGIVGKTILEVGAGCGESAAVLFEKGAKKVVCVEPNDEDVRYPSENIKENGWNAEIIPTKFNLSILNGAFDLVLMDCEGCEAELLCLDILPYIIIEVHTKELKEKFLDKGLKVIKQSGDTICIMSNIAESDNTS
jgi:tRNA G37 N-methylase Trm5